MASLSVTNMRDKLLATYDGPKWRDKVIKMNDNQVIAIFKSIQKRGASK